MPRRPGTAEIAADYNLDGNILDLTLHADSMPVAALRTQAVAAVPWLEQLNGGTWSGDLRHHREPGKSFWTGQLKIRDTEIEVPGLADPVRFRPARVQIDGARILLDQIDAAVGKLAFAGDYRYEPAARPPAPCAAARRPWTRRTWKPR